MAGLLINGILTQLNQYLESVEDALPETAGNHVVLGNMAKSKIAGGDDNNLDDKIVVSLVNVAEESALKNNPAVVQSGMGHIEFQPPIHANLYLLFASNFSDYTSAVNYLLRVMEFFQSKKIFKFKNAPTASADPEVIEREGETEISVELHTLSFEQLNDLWGSLGGKQVPFLLYRARLIPVQMRLPMARGGLITDIDLATQGR